MFKSLWKKKKRDSLFELVATFFTQGMKDMAELGFMAGWEARAFGAPAFALSDKTAPESQKELFEKWWAEAIEPNLMKMVNDCLTGKFR